MLVEPAPPGLRLASGLGYTASRMAKKTPTKKVPRETYAARLHKARGRLESATLLLEDDPDSALVLVVQAAIAAADALTIYHLEERSSATRHEDALNVLARLNNQVPDLAKASKHLAKLLGFKTDAEYGFKTPKTADVRSAIEAARSFIEFVEKNLAQAPSR